MPLPVIRIAPKPRRLISKSPPMRNCPLFAAGRLFQSGLVGFLFIWFPFSIEPGRSHVRPRSTDICGLDSRAVHKATFLARAFFGLRADGNFGARGPLFTASITCT